MRDDVSEAIDDVIEFSRRPVPAGQQVAGPEAFRAPEMRQFFGLIDGMSGPDLDEALSRLAGAGAAGGGGGGGPPPRPGGRGGGGGGGRSRGRGAPPAGPSGRCSTACPASW